MVKKKHGVIIEAPIEARKAEPGWKGNAISNQLAESSGLIGICALPALRHNEPPYPCRISA